MWSRSGQISPNGEVLIQQAEMRILCWINRCRQGRIQAGNNLPTTGRFESAGLELGDLTPLRPLRYVVVRPTISLDNFDCG